MRRVRFALRATHQLTIYINRFPCRTRETRASSRTPWCLPSRAAGEAQAPASHSQALPPAAFQSTCFPTFNREHVLGRVAALGFGFSLIGELLSGVGPIG